MSPDPTTRRHAPGSSVAQAGHPYGVVAADVAASFASATLKAAEQLLSGVLLEVCEPGSLQARVRGTGKRSFLVFAQAHAAEEGVRWTTDCTCAQEVNCRHGAALLLVALHGPVAVPRVAPASAASGPPVREEVLQWAHRLRAGPQAEAAKPVVKSADALFYALELAPQVGPALRLYKSRVDVRGRPSGTSQLWGGLQNALLKPPGFLTDVDLAALRAINTQLSSGYDDWQRRIACSAHTLAQVLPALVATGRLGLEAPTARARSEADQVRALRMLAPGAPRTTALVWHVKATGYQQAGLSLQQPDCHVVAGNPAWYLDEAAGEVGTVQVEGLPPDMLAGLLAMPPLSTLEAAMVASTLAEVAPAVARPAATPLRQLQAPLVPVLRLATQHLVPAPWGGKSLRGYKPSYDMAVTTPQPMSWAALSWRYGSIEFQADSDAAGHDHFRDADGQWVAVRRDLAAENAARALLQAAGFGPAPTRESLRSGKPPPEGSLVLQDEAAWSPFMAEVVPDWRARGWQVEWGRDFVHGRYRAEGFFSALRAVPAGERPAPVANGATAGGTKAGGATAGGATADGGAAGGVLAAAPLGTRAGEVTAHGVTGKATAADAAVASDPPAAEAAAGAPPVDDDPASGAGSAEGWMLELGVEVQGRRLALAPLLADLLKREPRWFDAAQVEALPDAEPVTLFSDDGWRIEVDAGRLKPIVRTLIDLFDGVPADGSLHLSRWDALRLAELQRDPHWAFQGDAALQALAERLRACQGVRPLPAPPGLQIELRPYQCLGLAWLQFLREHGLAGILADDMGLGKTAQTLAHVLAEKHAGRLDRPALAVLPTSLVFNWQAEAQRIAPGLRVLVLHGKERGDRFDAIAQHDLVLTTYPLVWRDIDALKAHEFHLLVLDEAQAVKNAASRGAEAVRLLRARHRLCITGTPLENNLGELWAQFDFLLPGLLGSARDFTRRWRSPIEKQGQSLRAQVLAARIRPFVLRRRKEDVAKELPPKTEVVRRVALEGAQRDLYETVRAAMDEKVRREIAANGLARSHIMVLDALLKLRQVCCDPRLLKKRTLPAGIEQAKLDALDEMLRELVAEGRRVLVFSQFAEMLALIAKRLDERGLAHVSLTGRTQDRQAVVQRFQQGEVPVFLVSLKAGGVGLNLTAADTVIHYDPWWSPAAEAQATDRAHRIGQDKPVFVYKLVAAGSIEERILALQQRKAGLAEAVLGRDGEQAVKFSQEDVEALLAPLG